MIGSDVGGGQWEDYILALCNLCIRIICIFWLIYSMIKYHMGGGKGDLAARVRPSY